MSSEKNKNMKKKKIYPHFRLADLAKAVTKKI